MGYPQPNADLYAINGYKFFRLNTLLATPGDIYESAQSGHAFALGPESDIADVEVKYYDQQLANYMGSVSLSPDRSMTGRVDANNLSQYTPSLRPARVLIFPNNLWNDQYIPTGFETGNQVITVTPRLDVIEYFEPQYSLVPKRDDKRFVFQELNISAGSIGNPTVFVTIPYYGRKYADYKIHVPANADALASIDIVVTGVTLEIIDDNFGFNQFETFLAGGGGTLVNQRSYQGVVRAGQVNTVDPLNVGGGMYDLLTFKITDADTDHPLDQPVYLDITVSDTPAE